MAPSHARVDHTRPHVSLGSSIVSVGGGEPATRSLVVAIGVFWEVLIALPCCGGGGGVGEGSVSSKPFTTTPSSSWVAALRRRNRAVTGCSGQGSRTHLFLLSRMEMVPRRRERRPLGAASSAGGRTRPAVPCSRCTAAEVWSRVDAVMMEEAAAPPVRCRCAAPRSLWRRAPCPSARRCGRMPQGGSSASKKRSEASHELGEGGAPEARAIRVR